MDVWHVFMIKDVHNSSDTISVNFYHIVGATIRVFLLVFNLESNEKHYNYSWLLIFKPDNVHD